MVSVYAYHWLNKAKTLSPCDRNVSPRLAYFGGDVYPDVGEESVRIKNERLKPLLAVPLRLVMGSTEQLAINRDGGATPAPRPLRQVFALRILF